MDDKTFNQNFQKESSIPKDHPGFREALAKLLSPTPQRGDRPLQARSIEDEDLHLKTIRVRRKNETIQSLCHRSGISPSQIRSWDIETIGNFVLQAERNALDDISEPRTELTDFVKQEHSRFVMVAD